MSVWDDDDVRALPPISEIYSSTGSLSPARHDGSPVKWVAIVTLLRVRSTPETTRASEADPRTRFSPRNPDPPLLSS